MPYPWSVLTKKASTIKAIASTILIRASSLWITDSAGKILTQRHMALIAMVFASPPALFQMSGKLHGIARRAPLCPLACNAFVSLLNVGTAKPACLNSSSTREKISSGGSQSAPISPGASRPACPHTWPYLP